MLRYSKTVSKAARVVGIGVGRNPQSICDNCFFSITCERNGRGPALNADLHRLVEEPAQRGIEVRIAEVGSLAQQHEIPFALGLLSLFLIEKRSQRA